MNKKKETQDYTLKMTLANEDKNNVHQDTLNKEEDNSNLMEELLSHVAKSKVIFKSQQKDDPDLTYEEKLTIARNILKKSFCLFLSKFGHYMKREHLKYFENSKENDYEVAYHINRLQRFFNNSTRQTDVRNRRYQALKTLIEEGEYFSEKEMMKRNPLLYEQLVGQYMTEKQKKERDNIDTKNITFVNLLMENIERENLKQKQKLQEEEEQNVMEETESDEEENETCMSNQSNYSNEEIFQWGKVPASQNEVEHLHISRNVNKAPSISMTEKQILKQEFVSNMYQNFLDGKDLEFDYSAIDDNEAYDNVDLRSQDEEDKYFDSESPETAVPTEETNEQHETEDELDIYMKSLKEQDTASILSVDNCTCDN